MAAIGTYRNIVTIQNPTRTADGDGSYTETWTDAAPPVWYVSLQPATARDLEQLAAGTVISQASHIVRGRYRSDITTQSRIVLDARTMNVVAVANVDERNVETMLVCSEVIT